MIASLHVNVIQSLFAKWPCQEIVFLIFKLLLLVFNFSTQLFFFNNNISMKKNIAKDEIITNLFEIAPQVRMGTFSDNWARG